MWRITCQHSGEFWLLLLRFFHRSQHSKFKFQNTRVKRLLAWNWDLSNGELIMGSNVHYPVLVRNWYNFTRFNLVSMLHFPFGFPFSGRTLSRPWHSGWKELYSLSLSRRFRFGRPPWRRFFMQLEVYECGTSISSSNICHGSLYYDNADCKLVRSVGGLCYCF